MITLNDIDFDIDDIVYAIIPALYIKNHGMSFSFEDGIVKGKIKAITKDGYLIDGFGDKVSKHCFKTKEEALRCLQKIMWNLEKLQLQKESYDNPNPIT